MKFKLVEKVDEEWFFISSDLSVNLAAGWLGVVFIVPNFSGIRSPLNLLVGSSIITVGRISMFGLHNR